MAKGKMDEVLENFRKEIQGFISCDVVNISDGLSIGGGSIDPKFDASIAAAYYATVASAYVKTCHAIDKTMEPEDMLITTDQMLLLMRVIANNNYFFGLAVTPDSNLAMCRLIMKKYEDEIVKAI